MTEFFSKLLSFLQWKKTTIWTICALIITYSLIKGYIDKETAILLNGILVALWLSANIATYKLVDKD